MERVRLGVIGAGNIAAAALVSHQASRTSYGRSASLNSGMRMERQNYAQEAMNMTPEQLETWAIGDSDNGVVTLPSGELEVSPPQESSGHCDCGPPRVHRRGAERAVRLG